MDAVRVESREPGPVVDVDPLVIATLSFVMRFAPQMSGAVTTSSMKSSYWLSADMLAGFVRESLTEGAR